MQTFETQQHFSRLPFYRAGLIFWLYVCLANNGNKYKTSKAGRFQFSCTARTYLKRGVPIQRTVRTLSESMCQCQLWDITSFNKSYPQTWSVVKLSEKGTKPSSRLSVSWRKVRNLTLDYLCEASFYVGLDSSKVSLILKEILVFSFF